MGVSFVGIFSGRICSAPHQFRLHPCDAVRRDMALAYNHEEITARELKPALYELDGISRETIEAHYKLYQGYVNKRNEILGALGERRSRRRQPGLQRAARAEGRSDVRGRRHQEPRGLLRAPRRQRRRADRHLRGHREARLRQHRRLEGRPQGDRSRRQRVGVDRVRLGRGPAVQLHRRRAEHLRRCGTRPRSSRSTSTSTRTSSTSAPTGRRTSRRSSRTSITTW